MKVHLVSWLICHNFPRGVGLFLHSYDKLPKENLPRPIPHLYFRDMEFKQTKVHKTDEGGVIIEDIQDCSAIVEQNKKEYNSYDENARWSDELFGNKIASIPLTVIDSLNKKGILRGFKVLDEKAFKAFLNDPDNRFFRTRTGRV
mgnify:FL=1